MSALAHFFEDEGLATTGISLVREHTAGYRPPRFLWVPFPLGRPFGAPGDAAFQRKVLEAALALLEREDGPVILEDFPEDAPATPAADDEAGWVCPVSFPPPPIDPDDLGAALAREMAELSPWYDLAVERRRRTTVGLSGLDPAKFAGFVAAFLGEWPAPYRPDLPLGENLKLACEDLKAWYLEAALARPGDADPGAVADWLWGETAAGRILLALKDRLAASAEPEMQTLASDYFIPRTQAHRL